MKKKVKKNPNEMTLSDHVRELKHRVVMVLAVFIVLFVATYVYSNDIMHFATTLGKEAGYRFVYISPQEVILQQLRIAGTFALLCTVPLIIYQLAVFISPIFDTKKPLKRILATSIIAFILFIIGATFAYTVMLPFVYDFLFKIGTASDIEAQISIKEYISMFITLEFCIGIITELPLLCAALTRAGLLTPEIMKQARSVAIVIIFIISALITPPDMISQCMVALPMIALYQISIFICKFIREGKRDGDSTGKKSKNKGK